jgi:hypothetical protein
MCLSWIKITPEQWSSDFEDFNYEWDESLEINSFNWDSYNNPLCPNDRPLPRVRVECIYRTLVQDLQTAKGKTKV